VIDVEVPYSWPPGRMEDHAISDAVADHHLAPRVFGAQRGRQNEHGDDQSEIAGHAIVSFRLTDAFCASLLSLHPGFVAVANRPHQTLDGIVAWLKSVPPMMPNHNLTQDEMFALAAYWSAPLKRYQVD